MYWHDAEWWVWIPMTLTMLAFWGLVVWVAVRLLLAPAGERPASSRTPREILDARLAAGEITRDDYDELRAVLDEAPHGDRNASRTGEEVRS